MSDKNSPCFIKTFRADFDARTLANVIARTSRLCACCVAALLLAFAIACSNEGGEAQTPSEKEREIANAAASNSNDKSSMNTNATSSNNSAARPQIIAFGDSLTAGYGLSQAESYPSLLQKKLDADGYNYEVINAGVSGDTSAQGLARLDWALSDKENPRIMILELGANDILRMQSIKAMRDNLARIIEAAQKRNIQVLLAGMLSPTNAGDEYQKQIINAYQSLADEYEIRVIPFFLDRVAGRSELNQRDGVHPNAAGTRIVADTVYQALKPMLEAEKDAEVKAAVAK